MIDYSTTVSNVARHQNEECIQQSKLLIEGEESYSVFNKHYYILKKHKYV
jgi:hypothetical protein